jgi:hypothetical protein
LGGTKERAGARLPRITGPAMASRSIASDRARRTRTSSKGARVVLKRT